MWNDPIKVLTLILNFLNDLNGLDTKVFEMNMLDPFVE
jgi:hypothetical protein